MKIILAPESLQVLKQTWHSKLRKVQDQRPKPFLDDKILTSWNALMLKGYCDAYRVFNQPNYLEIAQKNIRFLISRMLRPDGGLNRNFNPNNPESKSKINAYLEDYATLIDASDFFTRSNFGREILAFGQDFYRLYFGAFL